MEISSMATFDGLIDETTALIEALELAPREVNRALKRAINQTVRATATLSSRSIARDVGIKVGLIRKRMYLVKAVKNPRAKISLLLYPIPAILAGKPTQDAGGVSVAGRRYPGAFIRYAKRERGQSRSLIFTRLTDGRYPLREMRIPIADETDREFSQNESAVQRRLLKNFNRQIQVFGGMFKR
jgi:hypothetical protein